MNRRGFFRGLFAAAAIIPVSTKTIIDMGANTWRRPVPGIFLDFNGPTTVTMPGGSPIWEFQKADGAAYTVYYTTPEHRWVLPSRLIMIEKGSEVIKMTVVS